MSSARQARRSYNAQGRRAQAQANRDRILNTARELFIERGYAGTSIADIADASGVSVPTVFARFGSKVALLKEAVDSALVGDSEPVPLADRPEMRHVYEGRTAPEVITRLAGLIATAGPRVVPISMIMHGAADADPEIAALAQEHDRQRLRGAEMLADVVMERLGSEDRDLFDQLRDLIWMTNAPQTFDLLVRRRGWSPERYGDWAARTLIAATGTADGRDQPSQPETAAG
jgi:AcrR family transcriptional regulator